MSKASKKSFCTLIIALPQTIWNLFKCTCSHKVKIKNCTYVHFFYDLKRGPKSLKLIRLSPNSTRLHSSGQNRFNATGATSPGPAKQRPFQKVAYPWKYWCCCNCEMISSPIAAVSPTLPAHPGTRKFERRCEA